MTSANFLTWFLQLGILVLAAAGLPALFRLTAPKPRLIFWQLVLVLAVALPVLQPWQTPPPMATGNVGISTGPVVIRGSAPAPMFPWTTTEAVAGILIAGAILRLLWLAAGVIRLESYRRTTERIRPIPAEFEHLARQLGVRAELRVSDRIHSPVTFGMLRPVVLVPSGFLRLSPQEREPVLCHELLHIQRHDWAFAIGEELVRALLWFHPAIWWLLGRIQLTREQVVDQSVIDRTQCADTYVDALLAIATSQLEADLAPAPLFLKKRHLQQRVMAIVKGVPMSKRSLAASSFAVFAALPLVVALTAWQLPLKGAAQEVTDGPGVDVKMPGGTRLLHRAPVTYPTDARDHGVGGVVTVAATLRTNGEVAEAHAIAGPEELRASAVASILKWHFDSGTPNSVDIAISYNPAVTGLASSSTPLAGATEVSNIDTSSLTEEIRSRLNGLSSMPHTGDMVDAARLQQLRSELRSIDSHLGVTGSAFRNKMFIRLYLIDDAATKGAVQAVNPDRLRIGGNAQATKIVMKVTPIYPPLAKQAKVQGVVSMNAVIDKEGHVSELELISGHPLLVDSAISAVRQWVYTPTLLNGQPVEVVTQIDVNYTLTQ